MWPRFLLLTTFLLLPFLSYAGEKSAGDRDVCFSLMASLDIEGEQNRKRVCKSEIAPLLKMAIAPINAGDKIKLGNKEITNCEQYLTEIPYGGFWQSRSEIVTEAPFMRTCGVLVSLWGAQQGKNYFRSLKQALYPQHLPPSLIVYAATNDQVDELTALENEGKTAQDVIQSRDVIQNRNSLSYGDFSIQVIAVADVDKDGLNDYIVSRAYSTGTNSFYSVGYISPTKNRKASQWVQFDAENMPNPAFKRDALKRAP